MSEYAQLPFDETKQLAVLGHLLSDKRFFEQCRHKVEPKWFNSPSTGKVYALQLKWFSQNPGRFPSSHEIQHSMLLQQEDPQDVRHLVATINKALLTAQNFSLETIRTELTEWYHSRVFREMADRAIQLYNESKFHQAYHLVQDRLKQIQSSTFEDEDHVSFLNPASYLSNAEAQYANALTTGIATLNDRLVPWGEARSGALFRGDLTVLLAPSNVGKTSTLITMSVANIRAGNHVLFLTHEGRPEDIREKFLCCFLGCNKDELFSMYKTPVGLSVIDRTVEWIDQHLTYIAYNKAGMTVEDVIPIIRRRHDLRAIHTGGKPYDLIVSDYPAKLSTTQARGGHLARRNIDEIVYEYFVQLALELNVHCLTAIQTNRQGSKENTAASRLLTMEDVMESWGVMTAATNVISINRDAEAARRNVVTFYIAKSRSSATGKAVACRSNFPACVSHGMSRGAVMPSLYYTGTDPIPEIVDDLLQKPEYNGKCIDDDLLKIRSH